MIINSIKPNAKNDSATLYVQGCGRQCPGCPSADMRSHLGGVNVDDADLAVTIANLAKSEVRIAGAEPFDQLRSLWILVMELRRLSVQRIVIETHYVWNELTYPVQEHFLTVRSILEAADLIIDGYRREYSSAGAAFCAAAAAPAQAKTAELASV